MNENMWKSIKQFFSYFFVGGIAALVEWGMFFVFSNLLHIYYQGATVLAFLFSTITNWWLGRTFTFKDSAYQSKKQKEFILIFGVSAIGLFLNMILMYLWVSLLGMNTDLKKMIGKVAATGMVFFWNFFIRKYVVYRER
ncbi:MAG: GtrA family protein [Lachnospiraceae bacterium]|nr:GtrA family protein [Lachnospiraceae bacterium]